MAQIIKKIWPFLKNKYVLAILFFVIWLIFFDQNNLLDRVTAIRNYHQMERDKEYYIEKIKVDTKKLNELRTDRENLEKFAREQYYMKRPNEDVFVIVDE
jgi:cell division protein DivIC